MAIVVRDTNVIVRDLGLDPGHSPTGEAPSLLGGPAFGSPDGLGSAHPFSGQAPPDTLSNAQRARLARREAVERKLAQAEAKQKEYRDFFDEWMKSKAAYSRKVQTLRKRAPLDIKYREKPKAEGSRPSPYRGVSWNIRDRLWVARIKVHGRSVVLGVFLPDRAEDAARAYDRAARTHFPKLAFRSVKRGRGLDPTPPRAKLNFPDDPWEKMNPFALYGYRARGSFDPKSPPPMRIIITAEARKIEKEGKVKVNIYQLCKRLRVSQDVIRDHVRIMKRAGDTDWKWGVR